MSVIIHSQGGGSNSNTPAMAVSANTKANFNLPPEGSLYALYKSTDDIYIDYADKYIGIINIEKIKDTLYIIRNTDTKNYVPIYVGNNDRVAISIYDKRDHCIYYDPISELKLNGIPQTTEELKEVFQDMVDNNARYNTNFLGSDIILPDYYTDMRVLDIDRSRWKGTVLEDEDTMLISTSGKYNSNSKLYLMAYNTRTKTMTNISSDILVTPGGFHRHNYCVCNGRIYLFYPTHLRSVHVSIDILEIYYDQETSSVTSTVLANIVTGERSVSSTVIGDCVYDIICSATNDKMSNSASSQKIVLVITGLTYYIAYPKSPDSKSCIITIIFDMDKIYESPNDSYIMSKNKLYSDLLEFQYSSIEIPLSNFQHELSFLNDKAILYQKFDNGGQMFGYDPSTFPNKSFSNFDIIANMYEIDINDATTQKICNIDRYVSSYNKSGDTKFTECVKEHINNPFHRFSKDPSYSYEVQECMKMMRIENRKIQKNTYNYKGSATGSYNIPFLKLDDNIYCISGKTYKITPCNYMGDVVDFGIYNNSDESLTEINTYEITSIEGSTLVQEKSVTTSENYNMAFLNNNKIYVISTCYNHVNSYTVTLTTNETNTTNIKWYMFELEPYYTKYGYLKAGTKVNGVKLTEDVESIEASYPNDDIIIE